MRTLLVGGRPSRIDVNKRSSQIGRSPGNGAETRRITLPASPSCAGLRSADPNKLGSGRVAHEAVERGEIAWRGLACVSK